MPQRSVQAEGSGSNMSRLYEKRENLRAPLDTVVSFTLDGKTWRQSRSRDVSSTGMLLRTVDQVKPGTNVILRFKLPNLEWQDPIEVKAEVVRVIKRQGRQVGLGLRFQTLRAGHYQVVHEFVNRILGVSTDDLGEDWGMATSGGGYSVSMERLAKNAMTLKEEARELKELEARRSERIEKIIHIGRTSSKWLIAFLGGYVAFELTSALMSLASKLSP